MAGSSSSNGRTLVFVIEDAASSLVQHVARIVPVHATMLDVAPLEGDDFQSLLPLLPASSGALMDALGQRAGSASLADSSSGDQEWRLGSRLTIELGIRVDREDVIERVNWYVGAMVTGIDEQGIVTNSSGSQLRRIDAATKMWAAVVHRSR